ncbi:MAG TPA: universal stress protein [Burkholderiales bacterium]
MQEQSRLPGGLGRALRALVALGAELVVTGTRGRGALHHALLGSVALKTALASPVPVMLMS